MLVVVTPSTESILELQDRERSLYYSVATEGVLRREGLISTVSLPPDGLTSAPANAAFLVTRGVEMPAAQLARLRKRPLAFEGPLPASTLNELGLSAKSRTVERLELFTPDGKSQWTLFRPQAMVGNPRREETLPRSWVNPAIAVQIFRKVKFKNVLLAMTLPDGTHAPAVFMHRGVWISALPLFDIIGQHFSFPPLTNRYVTRKRPPRLAELEARICAHIADLAASKTTIVTCERWPEGYKSALTVRHDYDRAISTGEHEQLMALYRRNGVKASMGYLAYLLPKSQMRDFVAQGHEAQIHIHESDSQAVLEAVQKVSAAAGAPICGATIHGGSSGIGFRGDTTLDWLERAGLDYTESFSIDGYPSPLYRPDTLGILRRSRLVASPMHVSLDVSMEPEAHRLDLVRQKVAASLADGLAAVPMNHPDLHRQELEMVVDGLPKDGVWFTTLGEMCEWERRSKYDPLASFSNDKLMLDFGGALSQTAAMVVRQPGRPARRIILPAGSRGLTLNSWGSVRIGAVSKPVAPNRVLGGFRGLLIKQAFLRKPFLALRDLARKLERLRNLANERLWGKGQVVLISRVESRLGRDAKFAQMRPAAQLVLQTQNKDETAPNLMTFVGGETGWPAGIPVLGSSITDELHPIMVAALAGLIRQVAGRPVMNGAVQKGSFAPADACASALATWIATEASRGLLQQGELTYFLASTSLRVRAIIAILDNFEIHSLGMLVEHGAGVGLMPWLLSQQRERIGHVALVEPTDRYAEPLAALWRVEGSGSYHHFPIVSEEFEYPGPADVVIICHTLFCVALEDREFVLQRAWEALRPGGLLIINELLTDQVGDPRKLVHRESLITILKQLGKPSLYLMDDDWRIPRDLAAPATEEIGSTGFLVVRKDEDVGAVDDLVDLPVSPHGRVFDPDWFTGKEISVRASSDEQILHSIVAELALPRDAHVMDAADHPLTESGFRTADFLAKAVDGPVSILEARADASKFLADHFGSRAKIHNSKFLRFHHDDSLVDLIVLDLVSPVMIRDFEQLLKKTRELLKTGGCLVMFFVYDIHAAFDDGKPSLNPAIRSLAEDFLQAQFGRKSVTVKAIRHRLWAEGFGIRGLVDRWGRASGIGWLILEKL